MHPTITFRVNLETINRQGFLQPNRTDISGTETVSEADAQKNNRTIYLPGLQLQNTMGIAPDGLLKHGDTFIAQGAHAVYLKREYAAGGVDDVLQVVSEA
jgi:hypothetical protein